jgi:hypothetical protein
MHHGWGRGIRTPDPGTRTQCLTAWPFPNNYPCYYTCRSRQILAAGIIVWMEKITRAARKTGVTILGFGLLIIGAILLVLPGPGIVVIILGLVVLSWEYEWAKHHLRRARHAHRRAMAKIRQKRQAKKKA